MKDSWYIVDAVGDGSMDNPYRPKYADQFESYSCYQLGKSSKFLVRFYGQATSHNDIAAKQDKTNVSKKDVAKRLNKAFSGNHGPDNLNAEGWQNQFFANKSDRFDMQIHD